MEYLKGIWQGFVLFAKLILFILWGMSQAIEAITHVFNAFMNSVFGKHK